MKLFLTVFWRSMKPHRSLLGCAMLVTVLLSLLWVGEPLYGRYAVDQLLHIVDGNVVNVPQIIGIWIGLYVLVSITQGIMFYLRWKIQNHLLVNVREYYYRKLLMLDVNHHIKARGGELMKKLDNAADAAVDLARQILLELPATIITAVIFYVLSFFISWKLACIAVSMIPIYLVLITLSVQKSRKHFDKVNVLWTQSIGRGYDVLSNIFTVKSSASEKREIEKMQALHSEGITYMDKANVTWALLEGIGYFMLLRILLIGIGITLYIDGEISLGSVFFFQFGFFRMIVPMEMLSHAMPWWNEKIGKIRMAEEAFGKEITVLNAESAQPIANLTGKIVLDHVSFSYEDSDALHDISLTIEPGEHIALVGHSGAGKSTMAMILNRFYDVSAGSIQIDEIDIRNIDMQWWRKTIGLVLQENIMFNDSVIDNIRYSRANASDEEVKDAAKRASADVFIEQLPEGYNTLIGERGIRLSGGERQRIAIARAILKKPTIVVLDEATSALDSVTEKHVQEGIAELIKNRTAVIIAHRLSTVRSVDRIAVLDEGRLIACDTHENLLKTCNTYKEMVELQSHGLLAE